MFNERGQAFSVFKLVIAAVVAFALLMVLLGIMGNIPGLGQNPVDKINQLTGQAYQNLYVPFSSDIRFTGDFVISPRAVAEKLKAFGAESVCFAVTKKATQFMEISGDNLKATSSRDAKISVECGDKDAISTFLTGELQEEALQNCLTEFKIDSVQIDSSNDRDCDEDTCCAILVKTR